MSSSVQSSGIFSLSPHSSENEILTCPISLEPFVNPVILLEDGFTYERTSIESALQRRPNKSPFIGEIPSATYVENLSVRNKNFDCPITKEPLKEAYYCLEDGHTYEKSAFLEWIQIQTLEILKKRPYAKVTLKSPVTGIGCDSFTLYPNKLLFKAKIPETQDPIICRINPIIPESVLENNIECKFDPLIRDLICIYAKETDSDKKRELKKIIHDRRLNLGLNVYGDSENLLCGIDLSHLDLSNTTIDGLYMKRHRLVGTDFSNSTLINCDFGRCHFINCKMVRTVFSNCKLRGENVCFYKSNLREAIFNTKCIIEVGDSWAPVQSLEELRNELRMRRAENADTVTFQTQDQLPSTQRYPSSFRNSSSSSSSSVFSDLHTSNSLSYFLAQTSLPPTVSSPLNLRSANTFQNDRTDQARINQRPVENTDSLFWRVANHFGKDSYLFNWVGKNDKWTIGLVTLTNILTLNLINLIGYIIS